MFYLRYIGSELARRKGRTILTVLGLAVGVALVIVISSLTRGLDDAQSKALSPLTSIGTDLTVTREAETDSAIGGGGGPATGGGPGDGGGRDVVDSNRSVLTDLSKLGKPGQHFVHDFFLPGTQLTFDESQAKQIAALGGVSSVATGLTLLATHQEGVVPKIVAKVQTGGDTFDIQRQIKPPTAAELAQVQQCITKAGGSFGVSPGQNQGQGGGLGQAPPQRRRVRSPGAVGRSRSACPSASVGSVRRSPLRGRRSGRSSIRRRRTSRRRRTRSRASTSAVPISPW